MKIYIKKHFYCAGKWIYSGYRAAWEKIGFDAKYYTNIAEINDSDYFLMAVDADICVDHDNLFVVEKAKKAFIFAGANAFPKPWGMHPNETPRQKGRDQPAQNRRQLSQSCGRVPRPV